MAQAVDSNTRRSANEEGHYAITENEFMNLTLVRDALAGVAELAFDGRLERATETPEITCHNLSALMLVISDRLGTMLDGMTFSHSRRISS